MINILVNVTGIALIVLVYWFFFFKKEEKAEEVDNVVDIKVQGGYIPGHIRVRKGKPLTLNFLRTDPSSCLEEIVIPDFGVREFLPLNEKKSITITPKKAGEYSMSCGMNMFHGKITVQ